MGPILAELGSLSWLRPSFSLLLPPFFFLPSNPPLLFSSSPLSHLPPWSCSTNSVTLGRGGQAAGVQARSSPILGMTLGPSLPPLAPGCVIVTEGLLHIATVQWSRQKENVNSSPETQELFQQCPSLRGLGQAYCFPLGLSFHLRQPGKKSCSLPLKGCRMDTGQFQRCLCSL